MCITGPSEVLVYSTWLMAIFIPEFRSGTVGEFVQESNRTDCDAISGYRPRTEVFDKLPCCIHFFLFPCIQVPFLDLLYSIAADAGRNPQRAFGETVFSFEDR